jgi:diguanylate cyclase (GGDEF)-like protein
LKNTNVLLREKQKYVSVPINNEFSELVDDLMLNKWQKLINLVADIINVKAGLIMRITEEYMEVYLRSNNQNNPYPHDGKDQLGHGLYCETVIGENSELYVKNALDTAAWKDNPDVKLDMISYIGLPIKNPDGSFFGTICALDNEPLEITKKYIDLLEQFRDSIETDLQLMINNQRMAELSSHDELTDLYNRRKMNEFLENAQSDINRNLLDVSLAIIDLDNFKQVNDKRGHSDGDKVLQIFAEILQNRVRKTDRIARYGGDEFLMLCRGTDKNGLKTLLKDIRKQFKANPFIKELGVSFSFGVASSSEYNKDINEVLKQADHKMYRQKQAKNHLL